MAQAPFASLLAAMDYIADALPRATADNPKYLTKADGTVSRWLTLDVRFVTAEDAVRIAMRENFTQENEGKTTTGRHEAEFSLSQVEISEFTEPGDVTPQGQAARGLLFTCKTPGCVAAKWGDQPSAADKTDISVQDDSARAKLLAAFRQLQTGRP
ncbi:MAG: hypothetical protein KGM15_01270 [Pseudomonadota bacterium]|nr:hypothetical protein [Pseudomonadota bacterium]